MINKAFGYISFLIILLVTLSLVYTVSYLTLRNHQTLQNCYYQYKSSKLSESGINYYKKLQPELPQNIVSGELTTALLLKSPAITYTLDDGSFSLLAINENIYSIGSYRESHFIYKKGAQQWYHFVE